MAQALQAAKLIAVVALLLALDGFIPVCGLQGRSFTEGILTSRPGPGVAAPMHSHGHGRPRPPPPPSPPPPLPPTFPPPPPLPPAFPPPPPPLPPMFPPPSPPPNEKGKMSSSTFFIVIISLVSVLVALAITGTAWFCWSKYKKKNVNSGSHQEVDLEQQPLSPLRVPRRSHQQRRLLPPTASTSRIPSPSPPTASAIPSRSPTISELAAEAGTYITQVHNWRQRQQHKDSDQPGNAKSPEKEQSEKGKEKCEIEEVEDDDCFSIKLSKSPV